MAKETQVQIRLTRDEKIIIDAAAERAGSFTSVWLRDLALKAAREQRIKAKRRSPGLLGAAS